MPEVSRAMSIRARPLSDSDSFARSDGILQKWRRIRPYLRYWLWQLATKSVLGVIYLAVISEGLRLLIPALGQKLHKLPGLAALRNFDVTYRLDLAPFFAVFLLLAVFILWRRILDLWISERAAQRFTREDQLIMVL